MKSYHQFMIIVLILFGFSQTILAQPESGGGHSLSPYFKINTEGIAAEDFPLLATSADVKIAGPIADVTITQVYENKGDVPIEAIYVFPASTRAAVYAMSMQVGDRIINAEIQEKKKARATYEQAKRQGKRASLLEQHRPNVFQMNVGNMMPGDLITVELKYNEFLIPEDKIYSFIYPTVVGPRYVEPDDKKATFVNMPYTKQGILPSYDFDITVNLNGGMELSNLQSNSHKIIKEKISGTSTLVHLDPMDQKRGNKDFILDYSLAGEEINNGTLLYEHGDEKFFLTMIQPPKRIITAEIPAREYVFIMDVSGSMHGFPIEISKGVMKDLVGNLRPEDKFNVLLFAGGSKMFAEKSVTASSSNLQKAFSFISDANSGGGTRLLPALKRAFALPNDNEVNSKSIVVVTDGYVSVEREAFELIANNLNKSNLFAFGIGPGVNRLLIEGMAHAGQGEAFVITKESEAPQIAERFRKYIQTPVLTNIDLKFSGFDAYDVTPSSIPDLLSERPLYVFGKYKGSAQGTIKLVGHQGRKKYVEKIDVNADLISGENKALRYLWAREKIRWMNDLNNLSVSEKSVEEVTNLGLKYNLLTKYTSFVAVEESPVLAQNTPTKTVKQPLPLPEGVSNHAVGFEMKIEGVSTFSDSKKSRNLFVHVAGNGTESFKREVKNALLKKIVFTTQEKAFLNGNTLIIQWNASTRSWQIRDTHQKVSRTFKLQFEQLLEEILKGKSSDSFTIQINLLWV